MVVVRALLLLVLFIQNVIINDAQIGVCYGTHGNNLPSAQDVVSMCKSKGITRMRLYEVDTNTLQALMGSGIELMLEVPRASLPALASDLSVAEQWIQTNVAQYANCVVFRYIVVGNEIHPTDSDAGFLLPAMQNVQNALRWTNLDQMIKVSTIIDMTLLSNTYPPSNAFFTNSTFIQPIINFLLNNNSPLLVTIYPYYAYVNDPKNINLNYAIFTSLGTPVTDSNNGLSYQNIFDAMVDSVYAALGRVGAQDTVIVVAETGWPSTGGYGASFDNAVTYYRNLVSHSKNGTPKKPGSIEVYLFSMLDQNLQSAGVEQNFGLFSSNLQPKYQMNFN